ncbi:alkaline phosphatase D family protein [Coralloluteibacterium thermophilus]|uniref:Alkaline phosphatase D family protein n=1 Tax=Coralloluteibacterium thermophilum TaxID=2707049 RepID=A0ABV9NIA2_9GAMM
MQRRHFLRIIGISAAAVAVAPHGRLLAAMAADAIRESRAHFPQSVASGDPRPDRVLLWTRVEAERLPAQVRVQVADDPAFTALRIDREVALPADSDGCLKVRAEGLESGRTYHYRFLLDDAGGFVSSPAGRTRTAPAPDADVPLRFAFLSCQDYGGRWYNSLVPLLDEELDFVLHLGDFIYETVGDPQFQSVSAERGIAFDDVEGALALGDGAKAGFLAARSLSNYRQLHRAFRGDAVLQALLERAPLVAIWDDHEFSDDCWQDVGTYRDGQVDERDRERRRNAEQAYFEYMPVDIDLADDAPLPVERGRLFPNVALYRALRFGKALDLVLTDYRSARPDHPIPEDAFPGEVVYDRAALEARLPRLGMDYAALAPSLIPYVDLADAALRPLRNAVRMAVAQAYRDAGQSDADAQVRADAATTGKVALPVVEQFLAAYNAKAPADARVAPPTAAGLDRGLPWLALGKTQLFSAMGARYIVVKDSYDLFAALRALDGAEGAYGDAQQAWLAERLRGSDARFKVVASSVSFTSLVLDLARPELAAPAPMQRRFYLNVDHWDGFPHERTQLIGELFDPAGGVILLSGDIHAGFATQHSDATVEFTTPAVSSETLKGILTRGTVGDDAQAEAGRRMVAMLDTLFAEGFAPLRYVQTDRHGAGLLAIDGERVEATFIELPGDAVRTRYYDDPAALARLVRRVRFGLERDAMRIERVA